MRESKEEIKSKELAAWLDKIQIESWQLELVLSGFVIFLLLAGLEPYHDLWEKVLELGRESDGLTLLEIPYHTFRIAYYILIVATIFHVFLRGLWISTIGLRSVSGDIEWDKLKISGRYEPFLKKKVPSFDGYILRLETLCSISFAYTFLLVFSIVSTGSFILIGILLMFASRFMIGVPVFNGDQVILFDDVITMTYAVLGILYLLDFVTFGWFKRYRIWSKLYYPIYRFFGFITFANLYRPLYYNLIDNKLGRRLALGIVPVAFGMVCLMSLRYTGNAYMSNDSLNNTDYWYLADFYEDNASGEVNKGRCSIQSKVIDDNYIRLFAPYLPKIHDQSLKHFCPDTEPGYYTGFKLRGGVRAGDIWNYESDTEELLGCMSQLWRVTINDSIYTDINFRFFYHSQREQSGLLAMIPIHHLDLSEHYIIVDRKRHINEETKWYDGEKLWFYKN